MIEPLSLESAAKVRGHAKQHFIAQAAIIPKLLEEAADSMRLHLKELQRKEIDEWQFAEAVQTDMAHLMAEIPWVAMYSKLVYFQIADLERRRSENYHGGKL